MFDKSIPAGPKDAPKTPTYERDGVKIYFDREDPFGYLRMRLEDGTKLPEKFSGLYTDMFIAREHADIYINERNAAIEEEVKKRKRA